MFYVTSLILVSLTLSVAEKDHKDDIYETVTEAKNIDAISEETQAMFKKMVEQRKHFTSCEEFLNNTKLDINKILDVEWQIFYYYTDPSTIVSAPHIFIFRLTDPTLVNRFRSEMKNQDIHPVHLFNWTCAELFMETNFDYSALLLATNNSGMYDSIPSEMFEGKLYANEDLHLGLKFLEPHFLGFMICEYRQMLVMAPADKMPKEEEEEEMAALFNFRSDFAISLSDVTKMLNEQKNQTRGLIIEEDDRDMNLIYEEEDYQELMSMI